MATDALESREGRLAELLRLLMPFPGRLEFAVRLALICALTAELLRPSRKVIPELDERAHAPVVERIHAGSGGRARTGVRVIEHERKGKMALVTNILVHSQS
jgi:hypothetical protein